MRLIKIIVKYLILLFWCSAGVGVFSGICVNAASGDTDAQIIVSIALFSGTVILTRLGWGWAVN